MGAVRVRRESRTSRTGACGSEGFQNASIQHSRRVPTRDQAWMIPHDKEIPRMEPTGIEPVTSCLQRRPNGWRLVSVATRYCDLQGI
jgi:hypothetical protein